MDELKIESELMKKMIGKLMQRSIKKKYGVDLIVQLKDFNATVIDGEAYLHIEVDGRADASKLSDLL